MIQPAIAIGSQFGGYRVLSALGAGGMGEVYRAYDERLQRHVALKVLRAADLSGDASARLLREARAAAALNHPNICTVYEVGEHDARAYIAMELVEGEPLDRTIPKGAGLPLDRVIELTRQIGDALAHAHEHGVLHRDLKTANIVVTKAGRAKVLDFGLAKRITTDIDVTTETLAALTVPGTLLGTPAYMAPEQLRGGLADARSDVWALGVVMYEMASGERPFGGGTAFELSSAILNDLPMPLPDRFPPALQATVARCLEKDPTDRFQSAADVLHALATPDTPSAPRPRSIGRPPASRTIRRAIPAAALMLAAALSVAAVWVVRNWLTGRAPLFDSIAVLPLRSASTSTDDAYLAAGVQQALITELAQLPGLAKVVSQASTSRLEGSRTLAETGALLRVKALVTGSVERNGNRVRISAQLVEASSERQVWGNTYERESVDMVGLQNEVVSAIATAIEVRLRPEDRERLAARATIKPATYELYLRGMHELNSVREGGDRNAGLRYLQEAIDRDPGDPHAYAGLAKGYATLGHSPAAPEDAWLRARSAASRALTLAPDLADAHAVMGDVKLYYEWDWTGAERAFTRANDLNPNLAMNHYHYAWYLFLMDRLDEAIREHERARDLDPLTPLHTTWLADLYRAARRYDEAIATAKASLDMNPDGGVAWSVLSHTYGDMGRHDEAIDAARRAATLAGPQTFALGIAYARGGRPENAREVRQLMEKRPPTSYGMWARAQLYLHMGDADAFFAAIAHEPHHAFVPWVRTQAALENFRADPRYGQLMARLNLPATARRN